MKLKLFSKKNFSSTDKIYVLLYLLATLIVTFCGDIFDEIEISIEIISVYVFGTPLLFYLFLYKSLRNFYVFVIFSFFCLYHNWLFFQLMENSKLVVPIGTHAAENLEYTFWYLILFQVLRFASLKVQRKELVAPVFLGFDKDLHDNRKITIYDFIFFVVYVFSWLLIN